MKTPRHVSSYKQFTKYILSCAIRDRETYLEAITPQYGKIDEKTQQWIDETKAEITAMKERLT